MPGKSRPGKGKYSPQSKKKRKSSPNRPTMPVQQPAVTQTHESVPFRVSLQGEPYSDVPVRSARVPTPLVTPLAKRYPYIATELRTIAILAGVLLIVLVVLARVLS